MADQVITKQELIDAQKDAQTLEDVVNGEPNKLVKTRLGREVWTLASVPQINTMTREEVTAVVAPKANDAEVYKKTETFTKEETNALVAPKANQADVDSAISGMNSTLNTSLANLSTDANKFYPTLAEANAAIASIAVNQPVTIGEVANGGLWYKATAGSTYLTKSAYDPLTQAKAYADANANFNPVKIGNISLDTLTNVGQYIATTVFDATLANSYPIDGLGGIVHVTAAKNSSLIFQEFRASNGVDYWRSWNGTVWTTWKLKIDLSPYEQSSKSFTERGNLIAGFNLNDALQTGRYVLEVGSGLSTTELNYPQAGVSGVLEVLKNSDKSTTIQRFTVWNTTTPRLFVRMLRSSVWSNWVQINTDQSPDLTAYQKIQGVYTASLVADDIVTASTYLINNDKLDLAVTKLPVQGYGILKTYKSSASGFIVQEFLAAQTGDVWVRHKGSVWQTWKIKQSTSGGSSDLIQFTKTASAMQWYLPNSGIGTNKIRHTYNRGITPENNRDSWGMGKASVYSESNTPVQDLTTTGVWECAIIDSQNVGDHSGGGHGDEVKFLSYFLVDGVYYPEDFTGTFTAKEVKHVQRSIIYVEAQNIPICTRKTTWTFGKNGNTSKTRLEWAPNRTITKARIVMLPIYRKSNTDGTGVQVTDTEIRSQDDQVINVAEHGFALRDLPIKDGDSILLSSAISNVSAEVKIKKIVAKDPHAFVQNTVMYNKIYVNGFAETAAPFVTGENDVWEIEADFIIKVRS